MDINYTDINIRLNELLAKQINTISIDKKMSVKDIKRILKYTDNSIFDNNNCTIWKGYVTKNKGIYINFFFNGKKTALHRLLYCNFVKNLYDNQYLTFTCNSKGLCCNVTHMSVKKYNNTNTNNTNNIVNFNI